MLLNRMVVWLQRITYPLLLTLSLTQLAFANDNVIKIAFLSADPAQIQALDSWSERFETANPGYTLEIRAYSDASYKRDLSRWLGNAQFDLIHWHAGGRLTHLIEQEHLTPIDQIVSPELLSTALPANILEQVQVGNNVFALPFAQYMWGFYYNKELFNSLDMAPPASWPEFLKTCRTLKSNGIAPLVQPNIEGWETQGWLDFISMMIGGSKLRQELVTGQKYEESETDEVIQTFGTLIDEGYFFSGANEWRWQQTFPIMARELAGMTLSGQFAENFISPEVNHKIGFFPFPESVTNGTVAPLDVFVVPKRVGNHAKIAVLLEFLLQPEIATNLALDLGWLPVKLEDFNPSSKDERLNTAITHLINARMIRQYFDHDAEQAYAKQVHAAIRSAIATGDSEYLQSIIAQ